IESHSVLIFAGLTDANEQLNDEICRFILSLDSKVFPGNHRIQLDEIEGLHTKIKQERLKYLEDTDAALMQREFMKFHNWADDRIAFLEAELKEAKKEERELTRASMQEGLSSAEVLELQEKLNKTKRKVSRLKREMFEREDEINEQRDQMIAEAKNKLNRTITEEEIFTISFELV